MSNSIKLTEYSHGAGCGCKIAPGVLDQILQSNLALPDDERLLVGNSSKDDAAVYDMGNGTGIISTTDFFMPIVDDPFDFGRIAATNAISDVYAMGGKPLMAIAILGWPVNVLDAEVASQVVEGGRQACLDAGILLAGGHSIDAPEPIFGLAVTGQVPLQQLKRNDTATVGSRLYLTKPLGVGILSTAQKKKLLQPEHSHIARDSMCSLNTIGARLATLPGVSAMTDVTGFGLLGHLLELCEGSDLDARIRMEKVPVIAEAEFYRQQGCVPGGALRNYQSYGHKAVPMAETLQQLLCDPQTSGGLLVAVEPDEEARFLELTRAEGLSLECFGELMPARGGKRVEVL
ncbi:selenide, water dikinase SelD [Aestuariirhabdus sp. Z084]|uniref:selenide, water dikinase SelD n=1 Tax=Aestuariirhabdus haliotis TaxID=2918751 RepID=UPI0020BE08EF|nr:selenide, water dikinase SelD [Aestuariirhabdus haliotis]MCL6416657.1 selenide, water dikinase SelD [Aestuariirhabdus haliotis]